MTDRKTASTINDTELDQLYAELAALRAVARGYCPACGRGDAAPTTDDWEQQRDRADRAEAALADMTRDRDRQQWYRDDALRKLRIHGQRADQAEDRLRRIADGHPRADAIQAEIGEMIAQTHELRDQLRLADSMRQQNLDAAAAAMQRAERAEADLEQLRNRFTTQAVAGAELAVQLGAAEAALARIQALADEYPAGIDTALIHEALDGTTTAPAATPAAEPGHDAGPSSTEAAANDRRWWNGEKTGEQ